MYLRSLIHADPGMGQYFVYAVLGGLVGWGLGFLLNKPRSILEADPLDVSMGMIGFVIVDGLRTSIWTGEALRYKMLGIRASDWTTVLLLFLWDYGVPCAVAVSLVLVMIKRCLIGRVPLWPMKIK